MKITILHAYDPRNVGDAEIGLASVQLLQALYAGARITITTRYVDQARKFYGRHCPDIKVSGSLVPYPPPGRRTLRGWSAAVVASRESLIALDADVVLIMGGGYLYTPGAMLSLGNRLPSPTLVHLLMEVRAARWRLRASDKIHFASAPISVGPLASTDRLIARQILKHLDHVLVRERHSLGFVEALGFLATISPDIAFIGGDLVDSGLDEGAVHQYDAQHLAVNVMDWRWAGADDNQWTAYKEYMIALIESACTRGIGVTLFGMSDIVEQSQADVSALTSPRLRGLHQVTGYDAVDALLRTRPMVVSTRLHGAIMALTRGCPTLHLSYQHKGQGTLELVGRGSQAPSVRALELRNPDEDLNNLASGELALSRATLADVRAAISRAVRHAIPELE